MHDSEGDDDWGSEAASHKTRLGGILGGISPIDEDRMGTPHHWSPPSTAPSATADVSRDRRASSPNAPQPDTEFSPPHLTEFPYAAHPTSPRPVFPDEDSVPLHPEHDPELNHRTQFHRGGGGPPTQGLAVQGGRETHHPIHGQSGCPPSRGSGQGSRRAAPIIEI